jgi:hypothetical protein
LSTLGIGSWAVAVMSAAKRSFAPSKPRQRAKRSPLNCRSSSSPRRSTRRTPSDSPSPRQSRDCHADDRVSDQYDLSGVRVISDILREAGKKSPVILKAAVKHTGDKATSAMRSALVGQTGLKRKTLVKAVKGRSVGTSYEIKSHGGNIRLKFFNARETSKGVTAAPWNSRRLYPGTFIKSGWWPNRRGPVAGGRSFSVQAPANIRTASSPAISSREKWSRAIRKWRSIRRWKPIWRRASRMSWRAF